MYGLNKYMIDINIETLAGTTFSLKVSPLEAVQSVKAKIQRLEGIPISHQHLIWKSNELEDNSCLNDYNVPNGATIKLVLALRGGPINTRRMTTEDSLLRDVSDLMEIREDSNLWNNNDSAYSMNKHVTLLLFRDGDHLNLLRVIDRGDATSPMSGAMSAASMYVPFDENDPETLAVNEHGTIDNEMSKLVKFAKPTISRKKKYMNNENEKTRDKMAAIRSKMAETKRLKALNKRKSSASQRASTAQQNQDTTNISNSDTIKSKVNNEQAASDNTTNEKSRSTNDSQPQPQPQQQQQQQQQSSSSNVNNIRMKRYQIISDPKLIATTATSEMHPSISKDNTTSTSTTSQTQVDQLKLQQQQNVKIYNAQQHQSTNSSTKLIPAKTNNVSGSGNILNTKAKLTTIYTTTDRNGQVFIKRIHENYRDLNDDEDECEDEDDEEADDDEDEHDEDDDDDEERDEDDEENAYEYRDDCENQAEYEQGARGKSYYDDAYFVDEDEEDDEDDEDDDEDEEDDDIDDDEDIDEDLEVDEETNHNYYKINQMDSQADGYDQNDEENYDEEDQELLNKSELLMTAEDRQINNSPNGVECSEAGGVPGSSGTRSTDLMTMMMLLNLNNVYGNISSGGPISSSLATTALPTVFTPLYSTDNENFVVPTTRSVTKKSRSKNSQIKANKQQHSNLKHNNKLTRHENENENESDDAAINRMEAAAAKEKAALEEKLEQVRRLQKNKQRKRQLQLQKNFSQDNVNNYNDENNNSNSQQQVVVPSEHQSTGEQSLLRRRRKRRDFPSTSVNASSLSNSQTILLVQEEIDRIKSKSRENLIRANNLQQNAEEDVPAEPKASEGTNYPNASDKNNAEPDITQAEAKNSSSSNLSRMPSSLQKRVSFILTNSSQEDSKIPENVQAQHNSTAENQSTIEMSRRILKSRQPSSSSAVARNSLQAKVFSDQGTSSQSKPVLLSNYKIQSAAHKTTNPTPTTRNPHIDSLLASSELVHTGSESYVNLTNSSNLLNDTSDGMYQQPQQQKPDYSTSIPIQHQSLLSKRNSASRTKTPTTTPTGVTALTRLSSNVNNTKPYSQASQAVSTSTTTIESMQRYSASKLNKSMSISAQDLAPPGSNSSKQLRLPPVNNGVIIGGSTNNLTTIGLSETVPKKKIKDLSHYCYFCQRKTGLASSYTCRCGNNYCTQHRNAECHNCTYDYKTEGRKLIEHANPLVAAQKLPKI